MLQEQAESKEREERMLKMQQEMIDGLIVNQQRVDALLVQNYELHEYPIPRLFVIMPEALNKWDPTTLLVKKYRLHFLCECGEHRKSDSDHVTTPGAAPVREIPIKNRVHLTNHPGYELSRPNEFFDRYGPFVLGMLRILKHCLTVTTVVAPAVALAESGVKDVMDGVKAISERTLQAVDTSIGFLESRVNDGKLVEDVSQDGEFEGQEDDDLLQDLAALEGADLRRLESFLRNNDTDKVLGDLYRITTETGHVKWVCFAHYKETFRQTALDAFIQSVEAAGGVYDPHMRKVTISLTSSTSAKDFFRRLIKQDSAIDILGVSLDWRFGSSDLEMIVDKLGRSNVKAFNLDLKDYNSVKKIKLFPTLQPGKGRYHSLLGLLSNTKLRGLSFTNLSMFSTRTSDLPSNQRPSLLQSFHFLQSIDREECPRLTNIPYHCPGLVDLRLGSPRWESRFDISLHRMICSLKVLQSLHLYLVDKTLEDICDDLHLASLKTIKDLVYSVSYSAPLYLDPFHQQKWTSLEVLVFQGRNPRTQAFDLTPPSAQAYVAPLSSGNDISVCLPDQVRFSTLTHLDLSISLATESLEYIASILPKLNLVHFGSGLYTNGLLKYVNVRSLKALSVEFQGEYDAQTLVDLLRQNKDECQLDSLMLRCSSHMEVHLPDLLKCVPLKRLFFLISNKTTLEGILRSLNYSRLQLLSIYCEKYDWSTEKIVAEKSMSFRSDLTVELGDSGNRNGRNVFSANSRDVQGTSASLPRDQVILNKTNYSNECLRFSLLAIPSNTLE